MGATNLEVGSVLRWLGARARREVFERLISADARRLSQERLTYLAPERLYRIERAIGAVDRASVPGDFVEFGVALGGSAILASRRLSGSRRFLGFDVFGMIPPPGSSDGDDARRRYDVITSGGSKGIGGDTYYGYVDDLLGRVRRSFDRFGIPADGERVCLVPGLFEETIPRHLALPVAFAHVDCDWYDPVKLCLAGLGRTLSPGGMLIVDDYSDYEGCHRAVDEFLAAHRDFEIVSVRPSLLIQRRVEMATAHAS